MSESLTVSTLRSLVEDDIERLRRNLQMPELGYVDFSAERDRAQALARWPLLAELERGQ